MDSAAIVRIVAGLMFLAVIPLMVLPFWKIFGKAGFPPALSILILVPLANIIVLYYVAFAQWKTRPDNLTPVEPWTPAAPPSV
jgi:hypothetical protein